MTTKQLAGKIALVTGIKKAQRYFQLNLYRQLKI